MSDTKNEIKKEEPKVDELGAAFDAAREDASGTYLHKFRKPFEWQGKKYETLAFDFDGLTGRDFIAIDKEVTMKGSTAIVPALSVPFLIAMSARAAGVGSDMIEGMPIHEVNKIYTKARNFMLRADL